MHYLSLGNGFEVDEACDVNFVDDPNVLLALSVGIHNGGACFSSYSWRPIRATRLLRSLRIVSNRISHNKATI